MGAHARLLTARGHRVRIVCGRGDGHVVPELDSRHPAVEAIYGRLARGEDAGAGFETLRATLRERLRPAFGAAVVIAHNVLTMPFNLPLAAAMRDLDSVRVVAWTHDLAATNPRYADFHRDGEPYSLLTSARAGTRYVAISEVRRREMATTLGLEAAAVSVVPNGIDLDSLLHVRESTMALLRRAGVDTAGPLLLAPVRVTRRKRLELAIEAVSHLRLVHPHLCLVVSGPLGPHSADNRAYASDLLDLRERLGLREAVFFMHEVGEPHVVDDEMMAELYRMATAVILPSESEGFGIPVLEAGANRVPVVCTDLEVFREAHSDDAWTFGARSAPREIAAAIGSALATPQARLQQRVRAEYGWDSIAGRIEEVIAAAS